MGINEKIAESGLAVTNAPNTVAGLRPVLPNLGGGKEIKELRVDDIYVGGLIGRGGEHIKTMTGEVGCKIQIDQKGGGDKAVVLIGPGSAESNCKWTGHCRFAGSEGTATNGGQASTLAGCCRRQGPAVPI